MTGRWMNRKLSEQLSRRAFLKAAGTAAIVAAAGTTGCAARSTPAVTHAVTAAPHPVSASGRLVVSSADSPAEAVDKALDAYGGLSGIVRKGDKVLLKANFSFARARDSGAANHPEALVRIAERCRDAGASEVAAVDHTIDSGALCLEKSGIKAAMGAAGFTAACINGRGDYEERSVPGTALKSALIAKRLSVADVFINVPVIKSHGTTRITAGMKNLMGLVWDRQAFHSPGPLDTCIVDLAGLLKPDLVIGDACRVMKTNGPGGPGDLIEPREIIVGDDQVAVDTYAAGLLGLKPEDVDYIRLAAEAGLGSTDISGLTRV